ncbi:ChbG/HpnK family deacetylase [Methylobacillus sp.]|uniref:ChbG/HpnK family deacetylase n=1 Tax=Methylobacillus sp. TaxID=56818 RepID=UPI0012CF64F0|nr:ChbG/HpnK family deacetylase [Methylobacillus sp.]MPS49117.1 ChbG/HpnK family deacetylase [Methylobacillus sp.]
MVIPLIISADDYAQGAAIDQGILDLIRMRRLTATSCLSLSPRWREAATSITSAIREQADIGLHLDFTAYSRPTRYPHPQLVIRSLLRSLDPEQLKTMIGQQLDAFEQEMNSAPDYVDGHQHVHQLPQVRDVLLAELQSRYADKLPWIRISHSAYDGVKGRVILALGSQAMRKQALRRGFAVTDTLLGVYGFDSNAATYQKQLRAWLTIAVKETRVKRLCALMCHPGLPSADDTDPIRRARPVEYEVFSSSVFAEMLQEMDIEPTKASQLLSG